MANLFEFRFNEWARLHQADPEAFERRRKEVLEQAIESAPVEVRHGMREVLAVWEHLSANLTDPVERARAALKLAGQSFDELMQAVRRAKVALS